MNHFIFKSPRRLIKNEPINLSQLDKWIQIILREQRLQRQDLVDIKGMINRILIDKHLQMQVDEYFDKDPFGSAFKTGNTIKDQDGL